MADLPILTATDVEITLGGNTFTAKVLNLLETAECYAEAEKTKADKGENYSNILLSILLLTKSLSKHYPEVTREYVADMVNNRDAVDVANVINAIGGFDPKASEAVTGVATSESSLPTLDGIPEQLVA